MIERLCRTKKIQNWLQWVSCFYLTFVLVLWLFMSYAGDRWWLATLLLFGPRWVFALPILALVPFALWLNRSALIPLVLAGLLVAWPLMGFVISSPSADPEAAEGSLRILTCNTNTGSVDSRLTRLVQDSNADIVCLQECPRDLPIVVPKGWYLVRKGELAVLSRFPLVEYDSLKSLHPPHKWPRYSALLTIVETPQGKIGVCAVHLPSPRYGLQHLLDRQTGINPFRANLIKEETVLRGNVARELKQLLESVPLPVLVAGDFNMPVESCIYRGNFSELTNAFSTVGLGYGQTERASIHVVTISVRIDQILMNTALLPLQCVVGPDVGSDHLPLIADVTLVNN